jgi:hypothetical protein
MVLQVLASGMEHADETDLGAEMAPVSSDRGQRFGRNAQVTLDQVARIVL